MAGHVQLPLRSCGSGQYARDVTENSATLAPPDGIQFAYMLAATGGGVGEKRTESEPSLL
jgi:hypothetical protein